MVQIASRAEGSFVSSTVSSTPVCSCRHGVAADRRRLFRFAFFGRRRTRRGLVRRLRRRRRYRGLVRADGAVDRGAVARHRRARRCVALGPVDSHRSQSAMAATVMMARKFLAVFS